MKTIIKIRFAIGMVILIASCRQNTGEPATQAPGNHTWTIPGIEMADTIIYQVIISNPNPDDTWTTQCLMGLNRRSLVDSIFSMVYNRKLIAYDRETHEKLTPRQIKDIEKDSGFSRDKIGMIQFTEAWYLDPATRAMTKKVLAMELGYSSFTSEGDLFGYKSLFRVEMNQGLGTRD